MSGPGRTDEVGRVLGTEDATPLKFWVAVAPESALQLDDVVVTTREVPAAGPVEIAGVVTEVRARQEGATFASDVFLVAEGVLPAQVQEAAEIATTRAEPEVYVPPWPGAPVRRAVDAERDRALCFDRMDRKVPVGLGRDGIPVYVDLDFLDGSRGAHVSISGISGVATKTSFALFLLHSLFRSGVLGSRATNAKALVFSVKGEDLLFLDAPNVRLDDDARAAYKRLDLPAEPFASVAFFAPPRPGDVTGRPNVTGRTDGVAAFWWTIAEFCAGELLPYVFADVEDERQQYTMVVQQVATRLRTEGRPVGPDGAWAVDGTLLRTYDELVDFVVGKVTDEESRWEWAGPAVGAGTVNAFVRRLRSSLKAIRPLVRADLAGPRRPVTTDGQQVTVVDLHTLPDRGQRFVVGVVLRAETERKEAAGPGGLLFTMLDELNKYAPREGSSPIKELVLDIAERGRSLGIILIGAQQTASEVERGVIANSSVKVVGRLDPAEATRPEYGFLPASQRVRATLATPGAMFVSQPGIPVPLAVEFPFPAWATRVGERGGPPPGVSAGDPFELLPDDDPPPF
ncbi:MAG TPA: ATP-binding protein [Mycobacteriales bacterium]|nr:ATP-binding protein [Mycobacteriales bacterium]